MDLLSWEQSKAIMDGQEKESLDRKEETLHASIHGRSRQQHPKVRGCANHRLPMPEIWLCSKFRMVVPHETYAIFLLLIASNQNLPQQVAVNLVDHDVKADGPDHHFVRTRPVQVVLEVSSRAENRCRMILCLANPRGISG